MNLKTLALFLLCSGIWGSTWIVIVFQLGLASTLALIFYRFIIASGLLFVIDFLLHQKKQPLALGWKQHRLFILQGFFNFCFNYILTYYSESLIASGLVAILFALIIHFNLMGMWVFYKKPATIHKIIGGVTSFIGVGLLFHKDIFALELNSKTLLGITLAIVATLSASFGNMIFVRMKSFSLPVLTTNKWGMLYGSLFTGIGAIALNQSFQLNLNFTLIWSTLYLAIIGTVIAFGAYMSLIQTIGPEIAAYTSVISPLIALGLSHFYENFQIDFIMAFGVFIALAGNLIAMKTPRNIKN